MSGVIHLGGPKVEPCGALQLDVGHGLALCFLWMVTDSGALWDPGKAAGDQMAAARGDVGNWLWSLSRAEIYVSSLGGQRTLEDYA